MNKTAIALIAMEAKAIDVRFVTSDRNQTYTYALMMDVELQVGSRVLVPGYKGAFVEAEVVDNESDFDIDSDIEYKFIVGLIVKAAYDEWNAQLEQVKKRIKKSQRKAILEKLGIDVESLRIERKLR